MIDRREKLREMIERTPNDAFLLFALAMEHGKAGDFDEAVAQFDRTLTADANYVPAHFQKGLTLQKMGRLDDARAALRKGVEVAEATGDPHAATEMREALQMMGS